MRSQAGSTGGGANRKPAAKRTVNIELPNRKRDSVKTPKNIELPNRKRDAVKKKGR